MNRFERISKRGRGAALALVAAAALGLAGCDLDLQNPNAATPEQVFSDIDGVIAAAVGMQDLYAGGVAEFITGSALVTDEWGTKSLSLLAWTSLLTGENFDDSYTTVEDPWAAAYRVINAADDLIAGAPAVGFGASFENAILALAHLYRGMALGQLYLNYASGPLAVDQDNPPAVGRDQILQAALSAFEDAETHWAATVPGELGGFNTRVLGPDFDVGATIAAMTARYALFAGNYAEAMAAAETVDREVLSEITYGGTDENPIYDLSFDAGYVAGHASFVSDAEAGDERPAYWLDLDAPEPQSNTDTALVELGKYSTPADNYPVFLPDEMLLIRAEAHARSGEFDEARDLINQVRTQCTSPVDEPVACLPALDEAALDTEEEVLAQIAYERRFELYEQGLRWEDVRRLDAYTPDVAWLDFLPIPQQECLANTSISC